jgi:transposase
VTSGELKQYERFKGEAQSLRSENQFLRGDRDHYRREWFFTRQRLNEARDANARLREENRRLRQQNQELTAAARSAGRAQPDDKTTPDWVKPPVPARRRRKRPGRKAGHPAALRPKPEHIDVHHDAPLPKDPAGRPSCPRCNACLLDLKDHERIVEDIVPSQVVVKCYHTASGWCPGCRRRVESRAPDQPPAANVPHGQIGIHALSTAILLRVSHRLPFRQVARVFADLPGLSVCAGAVARQAQRAAAWLADDYERLLIEIRAAPHVHADETGWRTGGRNGYLWALTDPAHTLYHVDKHRSGKVIRKLLGRAFGGTLVSDFYSAYASLDCAKQKCLAHLLRELVESAEKSPAFAAGAFYREAKRLIKAMLALKARWDATTDAQYTSAACALESRLDRLLAGTHEEANERRIAARMFRHRKELTAFLWDKGLDGTNNAAERAIRPAVVARKISGGSRSKNGADAWAKLASLLRTAGQQGHRLIDAIKAMLQARWAAAP